MSMRIPGAPPVTTPAIRRPDPVRSAPQGSAGPASGPARAVTAEPASPAPEAGPQDAFAASGMAAPPMAPSVGPASGRPEGDAVLASRSLEAAMRAAERVRQDAQASPPQAARAHANLVPATVLNLLA